MRFSCLLVLLAIPACSEPAGKSRPEVFVTAPGDEMVLVPAGEFLMGSDSGEADEAPPHRVRIASFLMDRREVTQEMFARLELSNPSRFKGSDLPAENLTWLLAAQFCNVRSETEGLEPCYDDKTGECDPSRAGYRLPTEAEWEYACRAGTTTDYGFGGAWKLREHAWFADNASRRTHPAGRKKPNAWGLLDMHGNVAEWCNDPYDAKYYGMSPLENPRGPDDREMYVVRGGSWSSRAGTLRSAARGRDRPGFGDACLAPDTLGFRCVRKPPASR